MISPDIRGYQAWQSAVAMRARSRIRLGQVHLRRMTADLRMLPNCLIIGTMRGGTSSLYKYLGAHPDIAPSIRKETHFFSRYHHRGLRWYRAHFPLVRAVGGSNTRPRVAFEATPYYLLHPLVPERVAANLPDCRFIVVLREPASRAWSHHRHMVRLGVEKLPFMEAISAESRRLDGEQDRIMSHPTYNAGRHRLYSYLLRGHYADQLSRWFRYFPIERFMFIDSALLFRSPMAVYGRVLNFLDLPAWSGVEFSNWSTASGTTGGRGMPSDLRAEVGAYFAEDNERLWALIGDRFDW